MKRFLLLLALAPLSVFADTTIPAGFPDGAVWLSKTQPVAKETVHLYAPVYNSSDTDIEGDVAFLVDGSTVGTAPFSLDAGETKISTVDWKAVEGEHQIAVAMEGVHVKGSDEPVATQGAGSTELKVTVSPAPPTPAEKLVETAQSYVDAVPAVSGVVGAISGATEGFREAGIDYLSGKLDETAPPEEPATESGQVLGVQIYKAPAAAGTADVVWRSLLTSLLYIFNWQLLFYILLTAVLYILWKLVRVLFADRKNPY